MKWKHEPNKPFPPQVALLLMFHHSSSNVESREQWGVPEGVVREGLVMGPGFLFTISREGLRGKDFTLD